METIRSFIAIELPESVKQHLAKIEGLLKAGNAAPVKWVEPDNIHLTLKFLGETGVAAIPSITSVLTDVAESHPPFTLEINSLGVFPNERKTRIAWAGLAGDVQQLQDLAEGIGTGMEAIGFRREAKRFSPHITLGRVRDQARNEEREQFGKLVAGTFIKPVSFPVTSFSLIRSELTKQGPIYTEIASLLLK